MLDSLRMLVRFHAGLGRFLNSPLSGEACRGMVTASIQERDTSFLDLIRQAVYANLRSPYLALLRRAGAEYGDVSRLVRQDGVEAALEKLYDSGVYVRLDEFKGLQPIERPGLTLAVKAKDFDNPILRRDFNVATGGSTGKRRRLVIDLDLLVLEAAYGRMIEESQGIFDRPKAIWQPVPPGSAGLKAALRAAKNGRPMDKWFSPTRISWGPRACSSAIFTLSAVSMGRLRGSAIPFPKHVPLDEALRVAEWMSEQAAAVRHAYLSAPASGVMRICGAARERKLDISGSVFRVGGEPYTKGKRQVVASSGSTAFSGWSMSECGPVAGGCARTDVVDDMHLLLGKIALLQRAVRLKADCGTVEAFHLTTLRRETPKVMLNVDCGDYGTLSRRRCGCALEALGLGVHVYNLRSYEKLTTSGMHVPGAAILELVEDVLPRLHGGAPTCYQFVEEAGADESRIAILVGRSVPNLDEAALLRDVRAFLAGKSKGQRMMMDIWEQGGFLRVVRAEPHATSTGKTPALRVVPKIETESAGAK
jgi:hypothetical protein